jgi:SAM-dependent methyltransferase
MAEPKLAAEAPRGAVEAPVAEGISETVVESVAPEDAEVAAFFDGFAEVDAHWRQRNRGYFEQIELACRFVVPPHASVLEIGCGGGNLLAALEPSDGLGVDISERMVELARSRHPDLEFVQASGERLDAGRTFDYVVLSDLVPYAHDLVALFETVLRHSHPKTRVIVNFYSQVWRPIIRLAEILRLKARKPVRNWVSPDDIRNVLTLAGFETVTRTRRVLLPKRVPLLGTLVNGLLANIWPFNHLCLTYWIVARPLVGPGEELTVSVVCPCRNEEGNIRAAVERLPRMGRATELIFVEGGSTDGTRAEIERQIAAHPDRSISLVVQTGRGKGDAVRAGFAAAENEVLMILDGDLTVPPEDLPKFYRALADRRAELVNGSRLVYDLEKGSMRFLNLLGNRVFSVLFRLIVGQHVKDTLCGTKVIHRDDYARIAAGRAYFGEFDPFGDFDLLLGAGKLALRIVDLPVRYQARTYGQTNISRFRHGLLLLRMTAFAFWKFRVAIFRRR